MTRKKPKNRSTFGNVREVRPGSGRWTARYTGVDKVRITLGTYPTEEAAWRALRQREYEIEAGTHQHGRPRVMTLAQYVEQEYRPRRNIGASTAELYDNSLRLHILGDPDSRVRMPSPRLGAMTLDKITPSVVEKWHADRGTATGERARSQAYALLRTIMNMAVRDRLIQFNPCQIAGAVKDAAERPFINRTVAMALVEAMPAEHRTATVLTLSAHLRRGELLGLRRDDVDLDRGKLTVARQVRRLDGKPVETATKTRKVREIALPPQALDALRHHLDTTAPTPDGRLFHHTNGKPLADHHLRRAWVKARGALGLDHLHFHDLRHASLTWAAQGGATTKELMYRGGHSTPRAALIYQHRDTERDEVIAAALWIKPPGHSQSREGHTKGTGASTLTEQVLALVSGAMANQQVRVGARPVEDVSPYDTIT